MNKISSIFKAIRKPDQLKILTKNKKYEELSSSDINIQNLSNSNQQKSQKVYNVSNYTTDQLNESKFKYRVKKTFNMIKLSKILKKNKEYKELSSHDTSIQSLNNSNQQKSQNAYDVSNENLCKLNKSNKLALKLKVIKPLILIRNLIYESNKEITKEKTERGIHNKLCAEQSKFNRSRLKESVENMHYIRDNTILHHYAASEGRYDDIKRILEANKELANFTNEGGDTPLHILLTSKCKDKFKKFKLFIENGADITIQNRDGNNILHLFYLLNGEQKVQYVDVILDAVKHKILSKATLNNSINAKNHENMSTIQVAIAEQAHKIQGKRKNVLQRVCKTAKSISTPTQINYLKEKTKYTVEFCVKLLQENPQSEKYHLTLPEHFINNSSHYMVKRINKKMHYVPDKTNDNSISPKVALLFGMLILGTVCSILSGNMANAAMLSVLTAACVACYLIGSYFFNQSKNLNQSTTLEVGVNNQLEDVDKPKTILDSILLTPILSYMKGVCNIS